MASARRQILGVLLISLVLGATSILWYRPSTPAFSFETDPAFGCKVGQAIQNESTGGLTGVCASIAGESLPNMLITSNTVVSTNQKWGNVLVTNGATLTVNSGATLTIGDLRIDSGAKMLTATATVNFNGATLIVYGNLTVSSGDNFNTYSGTNGNIYGVLKIAGTWTNYDGFTLFGQNGATISGGGTLTTVTSNGSTMQLIDGGNVTLGSITIGGNSRGLNIVGTNVTILSGATVTLSALGVGSGANNNIAGFSVYQSGRSAYLEIKGTLSITESISTVNFNAGGGGYTIYGGGVLSIGTGASMTVTSSNGGANFNVATISGAGTLTINNGVTVTVGASSTWSIATLGLAGSTSTVSVSTGKTLTLTGSQTWTTAKGVLTGLGTVALASGATETLNAGLTISVAAVSGNSPSTSTISVPTSQTLTTGGTTYGGLTISGAGSFATTASTTTTFAASTETVIKTTGAYSFGATTTLTANAGATAYLLGSVTRGTTDAQLNYPVATVSGTGLVAFTAGQAGTGTSTVTYSSTAAAAGADFAGTATGGGLLNYYSLTSFTASATGKYTLGTHDTTASTFQTFLLIYAGSTSAFTLDSSLKLSDTSANTNAHTIAGRDMTSSAGTATISGTLNV